jgi:hypothetical protein
MTQFSYIDVTNTKFTNARDLKEKGIVGESISSHQARKLIESGEYKRLDKQDQIIRGDSDIRLYEGKMLMAISRNGGHFQTIAIANI